MTLNPDQFTVRNGFDGTITVSELQKVDSNPGRVEVPVGVIDYTAPSERVVPAAVEGMNPDEHSFPVTTEYGPQYLPRERPVGRRKPLQTTWLTPTQGGLDDFYVHPAHQGRGIGGMLLNAAQEVHQQQFGRGSFVGADPETSVSADTVGVAAHYGAGHMVDTMDRWTESKSSRDFQAQEVVASRARRSLKYGASHTLGPEIDIQTSLQDKLRHAGLAPEPAPPSDGSKQLSMLSGKRSNAPRIKKRLQQ